MTNKVVVVLTYPAHFYQTELTLQSVTKHIDAVDQIVVIADNISDLAWPGYLQDCCDTYSAYNVQIIPASTIPVANQFSHVPWIRQQMVKLHLDQVIDLSEWLLIDGDTQLLAALPQSGRFCSRGQYQGVPLELRDPEPGEKTSQMIYYVRQVMQDLYPGFCDHEGTPITASHPPIHWMSRQVLESLRDHVTALHDKNFVDLHLELAQDNRCSVTEWDLIEWYSRHYLGVTDSWVFDQSWFTSTWSSDHELGLAWLTAAGLEIDPVIWTKLPLVKYL